MIIRKSLLEFKAAKPGTVFYDKTTDCLSEVFFKARSCYYVVLQNELILGGAGIYPTEGLPVDTCELVKFYLAPAGRGQGIGKHLMIICEERAAQLNYKKIYLETMPELIVAVPLYEKMGYRFLKRPLGNSGHTGCDIWMLKAIV